MRILEKFQLELVFNDKLAGLIDFNHFVHLDDIGAFTALRDPLFFAQAYLERGAVTWPGEIDICPEYMYSEVKKAKANTPVIWGLDQ